jgi:hypothetical protein
MIGADRPEHCSDHVSQSRAQPSDTRRARGSRPRVGLQVACSRRGISKFESIMRPFELVGQCVSYRVAVEKLRCGHEAILEFLLGYDADVAQRRAGEFGKEALDEIEPRAVLGSESNSKR